MWSFVELERLRALAAYFDGLDAKRRPSAARREQLAAMIRELERRIDGRRSDK
jgi:hypothetical protein